MTDTKQKPLMLLDIDGVINAIPSPWRRGRNEVPEGYRKLRVAGYPIHIHEDTAEMVTVLQEHYDIVWFTLWNHNADLHMAEHIGLTEPLGFLETNWAVGDDILRAEGYSDREITQIMSAKTPFLPTYLDGESRPWTWVDDMVTSADQRYLEQHFDPSDFRLIQTEETTGITWENVIEAVDFAVSHSTEAAEL